MSDELLRRIQQAQVEAGERVVVEHLKEQGLLKDDYKLVEGHSYHIEPCPVCGHAKPELWRYYSDPASPTSKVVMCRHTDPIGPMQNGLVNEGCLLYMPPEQFYQPTERAAVEYWNTFAKALSALRRKNHWQDRERVLREGGGDDAQAAAALRGEHDDMIREYDNRPDNDAKDKTK